MTRRSIVAVVAAAFALLGVIESATAAVRVGANYRMNSDPSPFRGKDALGMAGNPANPQHIVAVHANYLTEDCEATASFDGGKTWTEAAALLPPAQALPLLPYLQSCRISNHLGESTFQTVAFGTGDDVFATSITPRGTPTGEEGAAAIVYKSTDGGLTWEEGVVAMPGGELGSPYHELPTVAVDPGAGDGGADRVVVAARETTGAENPDGCGLDPLPACQPGSIRVAVSDDGGQTFAPPVQASPDGVAIAGPDSSSQPVIDADGDITIAWRTRGATGSVQVARSTDDGKSWGAPVTVTDVVAGGKAGNSHVTDQQSTGSTFPRLAIDQANGNLYIVYNQGTPPGPAEPAGGYQGTDHFIHPASHVYFQRSMDDGATWSEPELINDNTQHPGATIVQTRHPSVSVAPNGRVDIVWQDRRHWWQGPGERNCIHTHIACDDARLGDTYYAFSTDGGTTFSDDRRITDRSHNNDVGYDYRFGTGWAYGPQAVALGSDRLLIGWMDSREGSFDTDNQDIYLAEVDFAAPAAVPVSNVDSDGAQDLAVELSRLAYPGGGESVLASTFGTRNGTRVVIVNADDTAGALAASVLARAGLSPLLLSGAGGLGDAVKAEVARLAPGGAYVIGNTADLSEQVVADLEAAGVPADQIERLSGASDAETAALIATEMDRRTDVEKDADNPAFDAVVIANPASPDAVAAAGLAAARRLPILFADAESVPAATSAALGTDALDIDQALVIGGPSAVSDAVAGAVPDATRLGGANQYETSRAVVTESLARGLPGNIVAVVDGARPMDAALTGAAVGRTTGLLLLAEAPVETGAAGAAAAAGLDELDRILAVPLPAPPAQQPGPGPTTTPTTPATPGTPVAPATPARCGRPAVTRRRVSKSRRKVEARVRLRCAGALRASATARKVRVRGKRKAVRLKTRVRRLSGRNRAIRVTINKRSVKRHLRRTRRVRVRIVARFTPRARSPYALPSRRTINVVVKAPRRRRN
jgi:putative cell wall-binding protein